MADADSKQHRCIYRRAKHSTRWSVRLADQVSTTLITVGGIGTIVSVSLVFVLLLAVVWPLFRSARIQPSTTQATAPWASSQRLQVGLDEYQTLAWALLDDGQLIAFRPDTGEIVTRQVLLSGEARITASSLVSTAGHLAVARSDGSLQCVNVEFHTTFLERHDAPEALTDLTEGQIRTWERGVLELTPQGQLRRQEVIFHVQEPQPLDGQPVRALAHNLTSKGPVFAVLRDGGQLQFVQWRERRSVLGDATTIQSTTQTLPLEPRAGQWPSRLFAPSRGDTVLAVWDDGWTVRYDLREPAKPVIAESLSLLPTPTQATITAAGLAIGGETLLVGDSAGGVRAWFRVRHPNARTSDGAWLLPIHELPAGPAAVTDLAISHRSRMLTAGFANGQVRLYHVTSNALTAESQLPQSQPVDWVLMAPKDDGLLACCGGQLWRAGMDPAFPEASPRALLRPIWYEGYERPKMVWQSSFAGVEAEMKLGLAPLVFGTIKATLYSMLFGAPIALLAAIYTSEFLHPRMRTKIKSLIEMMASLPSVVLGFLGGLVIAPLVEGFVPAVICACFTIPFWFLLGACLWQQLPPILALQLSRWRLAFVVTALALGLLSARLLGPWVEQVLFAGDLFLWLDRQQGTGTGAWLLLWLPLCTVAVTWLVLRTVNPWLTRISSDWSRRRFGLVNLLKFLLATAAAVLVAWVISQCLSWAQFDPRGAYIGTYVQRNALVVGFVMGFAIIPIIYTISEDALSTVPQHLRSASLGSGATPWQTAVRIVIPTAMSGLFSALMIGLGRAVGETMIVLMAAGNTPIMEWNLFNGFRTLSANIAVELPEAVRDSTHYRTLFLAALTLLLMTFVVNTVAEFVRIRYRRRTVQL